MSRKQMLGLFALIMLLLNQTKIKHWLVPPPQFQPGADKVVLYSTVWCGFCAKTRDFFAENHVAYQEFDVEQSEVGKQVYQQFGANGVPIIIVNDTKVIRGYDADEITAALTKVNSVQ